MILLGLKASGLRDTQGGWPLPPRVPANATGEVMGPGELGAVVSWSMLRWAHNSQQCDSPLL